jgi:uncharacterized membrane protein
VVLSCIGLSLLLSETVVSNNLSGWDIHDEFYLFLQVFRNGVWRPNIQDMYDSALSITILPSILAAVSSLDGFPIFTLIYPVLFSIVPITLYRIYRKLLPPEGAFVSVLAFLSYPGTYGEMTQVARQEIAEILLVLLTLMLLSAKTARKRSGRVAIILLTIGVVIAHYSIAFIYIFLMVWYFLLARGSSRRAERLSVLMALLLTSVTAMFWYLVSAGGAVVLSLTSFVSYATSSLVTDFFNPASRPLIVQDALGYGPVQLSVLHVMSRLTQYGVAFCLILGFLIFLPKKKNTLERQILPFVTGSFALLAFAVFLPFFAAGLNFSRFYQISLLFVSPCFYFGAHKLTKVLMRATGSFVHLRARIPVKTVSLLPAVLLFSYLLFTSGWVWAVTMDNPTSYVFDWKRMENSLDVSTKIEYFATFTVSQDVAAANWLKSYVQISRAVCADIITSDHVLNSYGERARGGPLLPYAPPYGCDYSVDYVFLSNLNSVGGIGTEAAANQLVAWSISDISSQLETMNRIYSGSASIYIGNL